MIEMSLTKKITALFNIILPSPFFMTLLIISVLTAIVLIVNNKIKNKWVKIFAVLGYTLIILFLFISYGTSVVNLSDNLVDKIFNAIYFPNIITYLCMMIIAALLFIRSMVDKKLPKLVKYLSIFVFCILIFLFIITLDTIVSSSINISNKIEVYTNESLIVLIQSSTSIFTIWCIILVIDFIVSLIIKSNPDLLFKPTISNDDYNLAVDTHFIEERLRQLENIELTGEFRILSEENFKESFSKYKKKKDYKDYLKMVNKDERNSKK